MMTRKKKMTKEKKKEVEKSRREEVRRGRQGFYLGVIPT